MRNHYLFSLRGWMIALYVIGGVVTGIALIALLLISNSSGTGGPGTAGAIGWLDFGLVVLGVGFLTMLFYFVAGAVDFRLRNPGEPDEPEATDPEEGASSAS